MEGPDLLRDVVAAGANVLEVFSVDQGSGHTPVDERALSRLAGTKTPRGPVAVVEIPVEWLDRSRNLLVSVGVSDSGNVGTMIRTAAAMGWGFAYTEGSADPWSPKTIRAGGGGQFQTPVARIPSLADISEWQTVATVVSGGESPPIEIDGPIALLMGEESPGLPEWAVESADHRLTLPMAGPTESLNVAVAAGIAMYALEHGSGDSQADV